MTTVATVTPARKPSNRLNSARWRAPWTTSTGRTKGGFWYVRHEGRAVNLTPYGAPRNNRGQQDRKRADRARDKWLAGLRGDMEHEQLSNRRGVITVGLVLNKYEAEVAAKRSENWKNDSGYMIRLFCDGHEGGNGIKPYVGWRKEVEEAVVKMATENPWYGYHRIAVMCRREGSSVTDRQAYRVMKEHGLLHMPRPYKAELHQASKLYELLPQGPNELWQMDVTYIHIPGFGWWYAVTVIDYFSRYLLACHLTNSYTATEAIKALEITRQKAERLWSLCSLEVCMRFLSIPMRGSGIRSVAMVCWSWFTKCRLRDRLNKG